MTDNRYWLSFAAADKFLGVAIVKAKDFPSAIAHTMVKGYNPGGQVAGSVIPSNDYIPDGYMDRLLTAAEVEALFKKRAS